LFVLHQKTYNLFIVYLLQNLISQTIFVFECRNMICRLEVRSTLALVFQKVYMWCPRERRIHTYIHCSVSWSWSPVWYIYVSPFTDTLYHLLVFEWSFIGHGFHFEHPS